jgi:hypothetical protein
VSPGALSYDRIGAECGGGKPVDVAVQVYSATGSRTGPVSEMEYVHGVGEVQTDGEAGEVGQ